MGEGVGKIFCEIEGKMLSQHIYVYMCNMGPEINPLYTTYVFMVCLNLLARYCITTAPNNTSADLTENEPPILSGNEVVSPTKILSEAYILKSRGNICKMCGNKIFHEGK